MGSEADVTNPFPATLSHQAGDHSGIPSLIYHLHTYMQFVEQDSIGGAVGPGLSSFPELFLCRVSIHRT